MPGKAKENLGFAEIWESILPRSASGRRVKAKTKPFLPGMEEDLEAELDCLEAVTTLLNDHSDAFTELFGILQSSKDPFYAIALLKDGRPLPPAEIFVVAHLCFTVSRLRQVLESTGISSWPEKTIPLSLQQLEKHLLPGSKGQPTFYVSDTYSVPLAKARSKRREKERMWRQEMAREAGEVEKIIGRKPGLKEEIAIRKTNYDQIEKARLMPELGEAKETLTHVHFRLKATTDAVRLEREINRLRQKERSLEEEVLLELSQKVRNHLSEIERATEAIGELDFLMCKAELAMSMGATRPEIIAMDTLQTAGFAKTAGVEPTSYMPLVLEGASHPLVRKEVESRGGSYQPVSIYIDSTVSVITGPNMGGKTVALSTVGLCVAMAQWGLMVPCSLMKFGFYDFIHFQSQEEEVPGLSSFATEIVSLKEPLSRMDERGLILLDEVGRGTNPSQGLALYTALLAYYLERDSAGSTVVATTHYHGLADMLGVPHWQVRGLVPGAHDLGRLSHTWSNGADGIDWLYRHMDYTLQRVGPETPTPQDALLVARVLGLNKKIVEKAQAFYDSKEVESGCT
ncbi:MAG: MutS-related protein [Bacillota bacterium]